MSSKKYKEGLKKALEEAAARMFHDPGKPKKVHLFLTRKQYESDPDGWHDVLRQRGLPDDAIVIVPSVFDTKGGTIMPELTEEMLQEAVKNCKWKQNFCGTDICTGNCNVCAKEIEAGRCDTLRRLVAEYKAKEE